MKSKLKVFIIVAFTAIVLDGKCITSIETSSIESITVESATTPPSYHPCPRSMNTYLSETFGYIFRCNLDYLANECSSNAECSGKVNNYCCQQSNGCNKCVGN
jgi:hypothetical protein